MGVDSLLRKARDTSVDDVISISSEVVSKVKTEPSVTESAAPPNENQSCLLKLFQCRNKSINYGIFSSSERQGETGVA